MLVSRLALTNFRVFADLELELPAGVVGVYGPNGSGKSTLVEAIAWALFGVARSQKDALRREGSTGECTAEVRFEHEGHVYDITRAVTGAASTVRAEARCDGLLLASGAQPVRQYVHHVLGMSAEAFRASVFCEQKQLDAFSARRPEERRRLILDLLGITPIDKARDMARARARGALEAVQAARAVLGNLDQLAADVASLEQQATVAAGSRRQVDGEVAAAEATAAAAQASAARWGERKVERDRLACAYQEALRRRDAAVRRMEGLNNEIATLAAGEARMPGLEATAAGLDAARRRLEALQALAAASSRRVRAEAALPAGPAPDPTAIEGSLAGALADAARTAGEAGAGAARVDDARRSLGAAAEELADSERLDPEAPCPLCGQELGGCYEAVKARRVGSYRAARTALDEAVTRAEAATQAQGHADAAVAATRSLLRAARDRAGAQARARAELDVARTAESAAAALVTEVAPEVTARSLDPVSLPDALDATVAAVAVATTARDDALRLAERLARRPALEASLAEGRAEADAAAAEVGALVAAGRALGFDGEAHAGAIAEAEAAVARRDGLRSTLTDARLAERTVEARLDERRRRLDDGLEHRRGLAEREDEARHLGRLAELLGDFRNNLVSQVGPALSAGTSVLFRELTDGRFDGLHVDPETFELRVGPTGAGHALERHSGSEVDLANLSLRVAVGEQAHLLSGGRVGLLVLDEVLGALDEQHRDRLLLALNRLGTRFLQVLVVTHDAGVKEQLPAAVEVYPEPGGTSTASLGSANLRVAALA